MFVRGRGRNQQISQPSQTLNLPTSFATQNPNQQTSFPELVGRCPREAVSYLSARGLKPILVKPNQPMTMDYRTDRVRVVTDPSGHVVIQTPNVG